jgi:outer membrane protein OmpA-like peptidoglycan-associated protein
LQSNWPELELKATLGNGASPEVEQGSNFQLRISAEDEASIAMVLVNAEGKAQVLIPHREGSLDRVVRGTEMLFPDALSGETLYADMPVGKGNVFVIASEQAIFSPETGKDRPQWQAVDAIESRIRSAMAAGSGMRLAVRRLPVYVVAPAMKEFVSTEDFVQFFAVSTRSANKPSIALRIEFASNSADLTPWSRRQLDSVGKGMLKAELASDPFMIEGHTDDVGPDDYNMDLSWRRARTVVKYLSDMGVEKSRLRTNGLGESAPATAATTEEARAQNRRVVVQRLSPPQP